MADGAHATLHGASFIVELTERARDDKERERESVEKKTLYFSTVIQLQPT